MGEYEGEQPEAPVEEPEVPVEEGDKYDGGPIPGTKPSEEEE